MKKLIIIYILPIFLLISCSNDNGRRKIRLAANNTGSNIAQSLTTTIRLQESDRQSIVVLPFKNETGDHNLQWMQKGLTEMLIRALSQSNTLSILSMDRFSALEKQIAENRAGQLEDSELSKQIGKEANVDAVLFGRIEKSKENLTINIKLQDPTSGIVLKEAATTGSGVEDIFGMVDSLSQRVKSDLQVTLAKGGESRAITEITTASLEAWRYYTEGVEAAQKMLTDEAELKYRKAIELDSSFVSAYLELIEVSLLLKDYHAAERYYKRLLQLRNKATPIELYQIELFEAKRKGDATAYIDILNKWIERYPGNLQVHWTLAGLYHNWNYPEKSLEHLSHVITIDPKYKLAYNLMAYEFANLGNFDKALAALQVYRDLSQDEPNPYDSMGEIHFFYGEYEKAERYYKLALEKNKSFYPSIGHLSELYREIGNTEKALDYADRYLKLFKDDTAKVEMRKDLASLYLQQHEPLKAIEEFNRILEVRPYDYDATDALYHHHMENNDSSSAQDVVKSAYRYLRGELDLNEINYSYLISLSFLSINYNVHVDETIDILNDLLDRAQSEPDYKIDVINTINLKFLLTLLYGKKNNFVEIEKLWPELEIFTEEMWEILESSRTQHFSNDWLSYHRLNDLFEDAPEEIGTEFYLPLIERARSAEIKNIEMMFRLLYINLCSRRQNLQEIDQQLQIVGAPPESLWVIAGPYPNIDGFRKKFAPEKTILSFGEAAEWLHVQDEQLDGFINFASLFNPNVWSVAYAMIDIIAPDEREVQLRFGSDDGSKIWLNDDIVWLLNRHRPAYFDVSNISVKLRKGQNRVLVKVCNTVGDWGFFFRVTDEKGDGFGDIRFQKVGYRSVS